MRNVPNEALATNPKCILAYMRTTCWLREFDGQPVVRPSRFRQTV